MDRLCQVAKRKNHIDNDINIVIIKFQRYIIIQRNKTNSTLLSFIIYVAALLYILHLALEVT
jgi:hypothetical protein